MKRASEVKEPVTLEKQGAGRYEARVKRGNSTLRIGTILGAPGSWHAETPDGRTVSCFNTRADAASALLNDLTIRRAGDSRRTK